MFGFGMVLWPLLVIGLIWFLVQSQRNQTPRQTEPPRADAPQQDARALLDERYARGEIDREDYLQRRKDLGA